ncbi:MAG: SDR family oxidoreductase [Proteobacteria bacterium]|nr:SDR family oxidoreductase [Pseudomonadota bacterium]
MSHWQGIEYDYSGAHVLVTGATSGIGTAIAAAYRSAGAQVTVTGTRGSAAEYEVDLTGMRYLQLDLTDRARVAAVAAALPRLDILVNNAGGNFMLQNEYDPEVFEKGLQVNLGSVLRLTQACRAQLAASTFAAGASVIGLASLTSFFGLEVVPAYGAAKAGLVQLVKTLSIALAKERIRVNAVAPGVTASRMTAQMLRVPAMTNPVLARTPLGRVGQPDDVAGVVLFLTSGAAKFMTGQTLIVDGGYSVVG